ncbi:hypothetical protein TNCV_4403811 [Trichonephila clavipes]|uniref:Uncharacterized protein n=1 Tax=Trichonephila clavipes TaxID=2585209 RepID=A0A8X6S2L8_TRICX|nr:hypothetical protein TNCV_4403811 [Trichonephila clavipes]
MLGGVLEHDTRRVDFRPRKIPVCALLSSGNNRKLDAGASRGRTLVLLKISRVAVLMLVKFFEAHSPRVVLIRCHPRYLTEVQKCEVIARATFAGNSPRFLSRNRWISFARRQKDETSQRVEFSRSTSCLILRGHKQLD